jgi:hypothetical protein
MEARAHAMRPRGARGGGPGRALGVPGALAMSENPIGVGEAEHRDGAPAPVAAAEADPEVVMGR